jgi:peroxiredoxin
MHRLCPFLPTAADRFDLRAKPEGKILFAMAKTLSTMLALGTKAPEFRLPAPDGKMVSLHDFNDSPALLVAFICNHCPYVIHIQRSFAEFAARYRQRGVAIVAINSNDSETYPDDRPEKMAETIRTVGYTFPYLYDETQHVARAYQAACTPDFFLFDRNRNLVYRGQYDDSRPGNDRPVTGTDLAAAMDALLAGLPIPADQKPSMGCNIKWKAARAAG